jgi:hypothetical protein
VVWRAICGRLGRALLGGRPVPLVLGVENLKAAPVLASVMTPLLQASTSFWRSAPVGHRLASRSSATGAAASGETIGTLLSGEPFAGVWGGFCWEGRRSETAARISAKAASTD